MWTLHDGTYGAIVSKIVAQNDPDGLVTFEDDQGRTISVPETGPLERRNAGAVGKHELARFNPPDAIFHPDEKNEKPRWFRLLPWKPYAG